MGFRQVSLRFIGLFLVAMVVGKDEKSEEEGTCRNGLWTPDILVIYTVKSSIKPPNGPETKAPLGGYPFGGSLGPLKNELPKCAFVTLQ